MVPEKLILEVQKDLGAYGFDSVEAYLRKGTSKLDARKDVIGHYYREQNHTFAFIS